MKWNKEPWMVKREKTVAKDTRTKVQEEETQRRAIGKNGWLSSKYIPGFVDIPRCGCGFLLGGVGMPGFCSEGFVHWCDVGELQQPGVCGYCVQDRPGPLSGANLHALEGEEREDGDQTR
ncbi:rCG22946 [Rattus norvegicus]|uniref:RCG22946 n=1 Tax=Rattus norvegicus TaxID=10116 RepID=A6KBA4_RAT|nr:rCG22946 [Rattus norvegicus]